MEDYTSNSNREKEEAAKPEKKVEKVVVGEVVVQKKGIGKKFKDLFMGADFKGTATYVIRDILIPAGKDMFVSAVYNGAQRMVYRSTGSIHRPGVGPRITYNQPVQRGGSVAPMSRAPGGIVSTAGPRRQSQDSIILSSREEADRVAEMMQAIVDQFQVVTLADLKDLLGLPGNHIDNKWGWDNLVGLDIRQVQNGYLMDFPPAEPIH